MVFVNFKLIGNEFHAGVKPIYRFASKINFTPVDIPPAVMKDVKSGSRQNLSLPQLLLFAGQCLTVYVR